MADSEAMANTVAKPETGVGVSEAPTTTAADEKKCGRLPTNETPNAGKTLTKIRREKILKMENITNEEFNNLSFKEKVRLWKKVMGRPVSPERSQILDAEITEEAAVIVYQTPRKVISVLENGIAKKWTRGDSQLHEMEALRVAKECGLLVPGVRGYGTTPAGKIWLAMDKIAGQPLEQVWKDLSKTEKTAIAQQLGAFMAQKRAMSPPEGHIGGPRAGQPGREIRQYHDYEIPACRDESEFNKYLLGALLWNTPVPFRNAFAECLRADHRIVYTHADFALRNIMVQDGQVTGVVDWENAGWFPEYWEYVKFFHQNFGNNDFRDYADIIFPCSFPNELITYTALLKYQYP